MASQITSLLRYGWDNLWKNRLLWLFSSLVLIEPLFRFIFPIPKSKDLALIFLDLAISLIAFYFSFLSTAGVYLVAYCMIVGRPIDLITAFDISKKLLWRIAGMIFFLTLLFLPFLCAVVFSVWQILGIREISHNISYSAIPLSILAAMWSFPITETVANDSKIRKGIKTAWTIFTENFVKLAILGFIMMIGLHMLNILMDSVGILVQNNFNIASLSKLDLISPELTFYHEKFYKLITAIPQLVWRPYSALVFTFAYLECGGAKMNQQRKS